MRIENGDFTFISGEEIPEELFKIPDVFSIQVKDGGNILITAPGFVPLSFVQRMMHIISHQLYDVLEESHRKAKEN